MIKLNGKPLSEEQFKKQKEVLASQKGVKLIEVSKDNYKTEIRG